MSGALNNRLNGAFAAAFLRALGPGDLERMRRIVAQEGAVTAEDLAVLPALAPLLGSTAKSALPRIDREAQAVFADQLAQFAVSPAQGRDALIADAVARGDVPGALAHLRAHGGVFLSMTRGLDASQHVAALFPEAMVQAHLSVGLLHTVNALKSGNLARADMLTQMLGERFDVPDLEGCTPEHDPELVCVLFMKAIYSDQPVSDAALERLFATLSGLAAEASLMRGVLYNVGLDVLLRRGQIAMADAAAQRALFHYDAAGEAGPGFYVRLYLAIIAIWQGDLPRAGQALDAAHTALARFAGRTANDALLLRSFTLIHRYEEGDSAGLVQHLTGPEDSIPFGELWPAMAEPLLSYGRRALASAATPAAALAWVQRWRLRQWRSTRFDALISVQEVLALQELGRWQEADEVLGRIPDAGGGALEIARLASALDRAPGSEEVARQIRSALEPPNQPLRQRLHLLLLAARSAAQRGTERAAVQLLSTAFAEAGPHLPQFWHEQRGQLEVIVCNRRLRTELRRLPQLERKLAAIVATTSPTLPSELTRQEYRVLLLLAEAQSNKMIAQRLGVGLPTVKFHVSNLLRKSGAANRKDVVRHALRAGWLVQG